VRTDELSEARRLITAAIVAGPLAWRTVDQLVAAVGLPADDVLEHLAEAEADGWLASWEEWPLGVAVTLTPWAAEILGVKVVEDGPRQSPRWASAWAIEPSPPKAGRTFRSADALADVVDPSPSAEDLAIAAEEPPVPIRASRGGRPGAWPDARREQARAAELKAKRRKRARDARKAKPCAG
jgi:hypothetical protein